MEIEAEVDETGRPKALAVVRSSGYPVLDRTALEALGQAVFRPGTRDNLPAAGRTTVTVRFSLR